MADLIVSTLLYLGACYLWPDIFTLTPLATGLGAYLIASLTGERED